MLLERFFARVLRSMLHGLLIGAAVRESDDHRHSREVVPTRFLQVWAILLAMFGIGVAVVLWQETDDNYLAKAIGVGVALATIWYAIDSLGHRIAYNDFSFTVRTPWGDPRDIPFDIVKSCRFDEDTQAYQLNADHFGPVKISAYHRGVEALMKRMPFKFTGYPPI